MNTSVFGTIYYCIFIVFFILFVLSDSKQFSRKTKALSCIGIAILTLFSGLRWETGTDWDAYYSFFEEISFGNINADKFYHFDFGYKVFNAVIKLFTESYTIFLLIDTFIAVYLIYFCLKKTKVNSVLGLWIFYSNYYIANYMGSNRRIIAIGCAMLAVVLFFQGEKKKAIILELIAILFHWTSVIIVLGFFIPKKIISSVKMVLLLLTAFIVGATQATTHIILWAIDIMRKVGLGQLADVGQFYLSENMEDLGVAHFGLATVKRIIVLCFIFVGYKFMLKKKNQSFEYYFNLYVLSICIYLFFNGLGVFQMFSVYFAIMEIIMWGILYKIANKQAKLLFATAIFVIYTIETISSFPSYMDLYIPYKSILGL